jgi:hypothetical protein
MCKPISGSSQRSLSSRCSSFGVTNTFTAVLRSAKDLRQAYKDLPPSSSFHAASTSGVDISWSSDRTVYLMTLVVLQCCVETNLLRHCRNLVRGTLWKVIDVLAFLTHEVLQTISRTEFTGSPISIGAPFRSRHRNRYPERNCQHQA